MTLDAIGDDVDDPVGRHGRAVGEPVVEKAFDVALLRSCRSTFRDRGPRVRLEGGPHGAMGVMESERAVPAGMPRVSAISDGA